jgi:hypothetical protein
VREARRPAVAARTGHGGLLGGRGERGKGGEGQAAGCGSRVTTAAGSIPRASKMALRGTRYFWPTRRTRTGKRSWRASSNALVRPSPNARPAVVKSTDTGRDSSSSIDIWICSFIGGPSCPSSVRNLRICDLVRSITNTSMPSLEPMTSESANRVAKFWFCGLRGDTVPEWTTLSPATLFGKARGLTCPSSG